MMPVSNKSLWSVLLSAVMMITLSTLTASADLPPMPNINMGSALSAGGASPSITSLLSSIRGNMGGASTPTLPTPFSSLPTRDLGMALPTPRRTDEEPKLPMDMSMGGSSNPMVAMMGMMMQFVTTIITALLDRK